MSFRLTTGLCPRHASHAVRHTNPLPALGNVVVVAQQDGLDLPPDPPEHRTTTMERGRFCLAECSCGWRGPARRARSQARTDAQRHTAG